VCGGSKRERERERERERAILGAIHALYENPHFMIIKMTWEKTYGKTN
jgi:hypothetical protein